MTIRATTLLAELLQRFKLRARASAAALALCADPPEKDALLVVGDSDQFPELSDDDALVELFRLKSRTDRAVEHQPGVRSGHTLVRLALRPNAQSTPRRRSVDANSSTSDVERALWLALDGCADPDGLVAELNDALHRDDDARVETLALTCQLTLCLHELMTVVQDPVTRLPGRSELQAHLKRALTLSRAQGGALSVLLVNPDDFAMVNHRYGREGGDAALLAIAERLSQCLRDTDGVFRYGGAVFAVVLCSTGQSQCNAVVEKVQRTLRQERFIADDHLNFSFGVASAEPSQLGDSRIEWVDFLHHADAALKQAKLSGGGCAITLELDETVDQSLVGFPADDIFMSDTEKDYRNTLLLWETVSLMSDHGDARDIAQSFIQRLGRGFQPDRLVLLAQSGNGDLQPLATSVRDLETSEDGRSLTRPVDLTARERALVHEAITTREVVRVSNDDSGQLACAVPLLVGSSALGCIYLDGRDRRLRLDSSDTLFLTALAGQVAIAMDRAELATRWIHAKEHESHQLREELASLKQNLDANRPIFASSEMRSLLDTLKRVAPSDATVLITGESGTGKEVLAHTLHDYSARKDKPFVVFDCGAVAHSLIEAELFGHVKGAFTGAERASEGTIALADGGTLFLDEIGELPLSVQTKLLRFVQEREYSAVGSSRPRSVDVRLVAATNRRLQTEVSEGRFRSDLYYRLQVISLEALPLRHRTADILPLAEHFLERYAAQNRRHAHFTSAAKHRLMEYDWPGNVRELQNCVLRTLLTAPGESIDAHDIDFLPEGIGLNDLPSMGSPHSDPVDDEPSDNDGEANIWDRLREVLSGQVEIALKHNPRRPVPLGRWLTEDLICAASTVSGGVSSRAAQAVGIPESTFRRQLQRAQADADAGIAQRIPSWDSVPALLVSLVDESADSGENLIDKAREMLLEDIHDVCDGRVSVGAALMGISAPTYKRWVADVI